jgi:hypothetical protein
MKPKLNQDLIKKELIKKFTNAIGQSKSRIHVCNGNGKTKHMIEHANRTGYAIIYC